MTKHTPTDLNQFRRAKLRQRGKETTLCRRGFHKWRFDEKKQFDVKLGKLISVERCVRCGISRNHVQ